MRRRLSGMVAALVVGAGFWPGAGFAGETFTLVNADKSAEIVVEVEAVTGSELRFVRGGTRQTMKLELLEEANRNALVEFARKHKIYDRYPPLDVQVAIRDTDRRQSGSSYMRHLWLTPQVTVRSEERLAQIPELEMTVSVICAETEALWADRRKLYQIRAKETKLIPSAPDGEPRRLDFKTFELEFDEDRNRSNVGGWIYRHWICCLRDPESKRIVYFDTSYTLLKRYLESHPDQKERFVAIEIGGDVPTTAAEMEPQDAKPVPAIPALVPTRVPTP